MEESTPEGPPSVRAEQGNLPSTLWSELWSRIIERLNVGEVLITHEQFQSAFEDDYFQLTGTPVPQATQQQLRRVIAQVNRRHPETYAAKGVQNGVSRAFAEGVRTLKWDTAKVQAKGARCIERFGKKDKVHDLLEEVNVTLQQIDVMHCIKNAVEELGSGRFAPTLSPLPPVPSLLEGLDQLATEAVQPKSEPSLVVIDREIQAAIAVGDIDEREVARRAQEVQERQTELEAHEMVKVPQNLVAYVDEGRISKEEAEKVQALREVDLDLEEGEIDEFEAGNIRNSILGGQARDALEKKVKEAVDQAVRYLQVFESMQKISAQYDGALRFIIRHKEAVLSQQAGSAALAEVIEALMGDAPMLESVIEVMERKDQELRMLSVRLPPYNYVMGRNLERIGNPTIKEEFVEDLRTLNVEELSDRLNSPDASVRVQPAADIRCFIALVDHAVKRTPFRKELRMLRIGQSIEEFYNSTSDLNEARQQAENFMNRRLYRLFPDMSTEESSEIKQRGTEMIDAIEEKVLEERRAEVEAKRQKTGEAVQAKSRVGEEDEEDDGDLTEEEEAQGVFMARVEMRVAGSYRRVPYRIMPDIEEPERFVIVQRDPDTEELVPQMRRGAKRFVEKNARDGIWKPV